MTQAAAFVDSLVGMRVGGRYVVERLLGVGGMGVVAAGRYPELGQKVAIKLLRPEFADDAVVSARFLREARVAAKVKSSHFVRVYDVGKLDSGIPYLVMEMLSGRDLSDELRARGPLPVDDAVDIILQAAAGLAELHALGIVHRDLKPSNLFITDVGGARIVKVLDFGISKEKLSQSRGPLTATDNVLGTPQYMSPEQVKASKDVDTRSDVWSLGVILYELLTQKYPFDSNGVGELFARILYFDPASPSEYRPDLPAGLEPVILKCLARDLAERYESVGALAEALRPFASPASQHRIDAVHAALSSAPPPDDDDDDAPIDPQPAPVRGALPASLPATVNAGGVHSKPTRMVVEVAEPASIVGSSVELAPPRRRSRAWLFATLGAAAAIVGSSAFFLSSRRPNEEPTPAAASAVSADHAAVEPPSSVTATPSAAVPSMPLAEAASATVAAVAGAGATSVVPPRTGKSAAIPSATSPLAAKPPAHRASASRPQAPLDPILDRK